jgi:hypothetical protein
VLRPLSRNGSLLAGYGRFGRPPTRKRLAAQCLSALAARCRSRSTAGNPSVETVLVTRQYANCPIGRGVADEAFTLELCYAAGMICRRVAFSALSGIPATGRGRDARKDTENQEVRLIGGEERLDSCLPVSCGKERI